MSRRKSAALVAVVCITAVMLGPVGAATAQEQGDYGLFLSDFQTIELAERTVTIEGTEFTESSITRVQRGSPIAFSVNPPSLDSSYEVNLYNEEFQIVKSVSGTGPASMSFSSTNLEQGSYMVGVVADGEIQAIQSVVVSGYRVRLQSVGEEGTSATVGNETTVAVTVSVTQDFATEPPNRVQVALVNDERARFVTATRDGNSDTYTARVGTPGLPRGRYTVVGAVRGVETLENGDRVVQGLSGTGSLRITEDVAPPEVVAGQPSNDADGDGVYEDVNGDGDVTPGDATVLFNSVFERQDVVLENSALYDVNSDGEVTPGDATVLFNQAFEQSQNRAIAADLEG